MTGKWKFLRWILLVGVFCGLGVGVLLWRSPDPAYTLRQWAALGRYQEHDALITEIATKHQVDPFLIKAMVWRESRFHPDKTGAAGERGLMQIGEAAAQEWALAHKIETFVFTDLFDPRTNLDVGTWYLKRALDKWKGRDDPIPFALAEYNAGHRRADRWAGEASRTAAQMMAQADISSTHRYVQAIVHRREMYQKYGW